MRIALSLLAATLSYSGTAEAAVPKPAALIADAQELGRMLNGLVRSLERAR